MKTELKDPTLKRWEKHGVNDFNINIIIGKIFKQLDVKNIEDKINKITNVNTHSVNSFIGRGDSIFLHSNDEIINFKITDENSSDIEKKFERSINKLISLIK
jgi:hypothetical protein